MPRSSARHSGRTSCPGERLHRSVSAGVSSAHRVLSERPQQRLQGLDTVGSDGGEGGVVPVDRSADVVRPLAPGLAGPALASAALPASRPRLGWSAVVRPRAEEKVRRMARGFSVSTLSRCRVVIVSTRSASATRAGDSWRARNPVGSPSKRRSTSAARAPCRSRPPPACPLYAPSASLRSRSVAKARGEALGRGGAADVAGAANSRRTSSLPPRMVSVRIAAPQLLLRDAATP